MKAYPAYKNCDNKKIGKIPEHWSSKKLKYVSNTLPSNIDKKSKEGESIIFLCNYMDVYRNEFITDDITFMKATASDIQIEKFLLKNGDVLVTKDSEDPKDIAVPALVTKNYENVVCGYHLTRIRPKHEILGRYLFRLLQAKPFNSYFEVNAKGVTRFGLGTEAFLNFEILVPTIQEQTAIANFLDHKTAQIDLSIEKGQQLIELLQEQRAAIINEAVTKGINPDVPMKDSGIEWIGEVPAHWEKVKLKHLGLIKYGLGQPPKRKDDGLPIIRATNIYRGKISEKNMIYVDPEDVPYDRDPVLKENDIIVVRSGAYTADSAIISKKYVGAITGYDMVFRPISIIPNFIAYGFLSNYILFNQLYLHRLRAAQPHLNAEELGDTWILLPPEDEQKAIVYYIETETNKIDQEIQSIQKEIELLKEYRQSLIAEAVTGKIDVRDYPLK